MLFDGLFSEQELTCNHRPAAPQRTGAAFAPGVSNHAGNLALRSHPATWAYSPGPDFFLIIRNAARTSARRR